MEIPVGGKRGCLSSDWGCHFGLIVQMVNTSVTTLIRLDESRVRWLPRCIAGAGSWDETARQPRLFGEPMSEQIYD